MKSCSEHREYYSASAAAAVEYFAEQAKRQGVVFISHACLLLAIISTKPLCHSVCAIICQLAKDITRALRERVPSTTAEQSHRTL